jgi:hypothetical protein
MRKNRLIVNVLVAASLCAGVTVPSFAEDAPAAKSAPAAGKADQTPKAEPNVVKGKVVDSRGEPVAGAAVVIDHTLFYNSNVQIKSGKDGSYRIAVPQQGTFRVLASLTREYHGKKYKFDLHPDTTDDFVASDGAIRNFVWKLSGEKPEGLLGNYGSPVIAYTVPGDYSMQMTDIELTLTPDGALIDGSKGEPLTAKLKSTGDGWAIPDVPVGRYKITARHAPEGEKPTPIQVRLRNTGKFADSLTADFDNPNGTGLAIHRIDVEVKKP